MPKVSVIVPSYNHGGFLRECLASVQGQSFTDWELVVVDDGSTDDSAAIAREFADSDPRIRAFVNPVNLGTYGTQARALELASGEYVAVLNSDDAWLPDKLSKQVELLDREPGVPLCYVLGWKTDETGAVDSTDDVHADWPTDEVQDVLPWLLEENRILASGVVFRRSALAFDTSLRYSGDWVALLRLARGSRVGCVPERLTTWRVHGGNAHVASAEQVAEEVRVRRAVLADPSAWQMDGRDPAAVRRGLGVCATFLSALEVLVGNGGEARRAARNALRLRGPSASSLKRAMVVHFPVDIARKLLWGSGDGVLDSRQRESARNRISQASALGL